MNISKRHLLAGVLAFSMFAPRSIWANSKFLNVQGALTDSSGNPLTGTQTVAFRLYTSSTAAVSTNLWQESQSITFVSSGLFNVTLGALTALDPIAFDQVYYLGIAVNAGTELSPRQPLGASAYALGSLGSFNVGNGLVIVGTATVQGNALSVGGTGFTVSYGVVVASNSMTAASYIAGTSVGITSACPAGYYFSTMTVTGGIVTGGGCIQAGISVATGPTTGIGSIPLPHETTVYFDSTYFTAVDSSTIGSTIISLNISSAGASIYNAVVPFNSTTCPTGWVAANGSNGTPDLRGLFIRGQGTNASAFDANGNGYTAVFGTTQTDAMQGHIHGLPGETFAAGSGGTSAFQVVSGGGSLSSLVPSSDGSHGIPRISTDTHPANYALTYCVSTSTGIGVTGPTGPTGATGATGPTGPDGSSVTITWQNDNFIGQVTGSQKSFTLSQTPSSTAAVTCVLDGLTLGASDYTFTMPTSISVTTAPAVNSTSFFCRYTLFTSTLPTVFILNSTQTVSGTTDFSAPIYSSAAVHISSGGSVNFAPTLNFTSAQTSFTPLAAVTGTTISFTVQGTTVACWFTGSAEGSSASGFITVGIRMDGTSYPITGTSSTVGLIALNAQGSTSSVNLSFPPTEFQVTGGGTSHTFAVGLWESNGQTLTFPSQVSGAGTVGQFGCREVMSR